MFGDVGKFVEMEYWSVQQRTAAVELFIKTQSVTATHRGFRQQFLAAIICRCGYRNGVKLDP